MTCCGRSFQPDRLASRFHSSEAIPVDSLSVSDNRPFATSDINCSKRSKFDFPLALGPTSRLRLPGCQVTSLNDRYPWTSNSWIAMFTFSLGKAHLFASRGARYPGIGLLLRHRQFYALRRLRCNSRMRSPTTAKSVTGQPEASTCSSNVFIETFLKYCLEIVGRSRDRPRNGCYCRLHLRIHAKMKEIVSGHRT